LTAIRADQEKDYELGTPIALRAPEVILRAGYDCKIDIWAVGCMVSDSCGAAGCDILIMLQAFELLTGTWAFDPRGGSGFSADDEHLAEDEVPILLWYIRERSRNHGIEAQPCCPW